MVSIFAIAAIARSAIDLDMVVDCCDVNSLRLPTCDFCGNCIGKRQTRSFGLASVYGRQDISRLCTWCWTNENARSGTLITTKMLKSAHAAVVHEVPGPAAGGFGGGGFGGGGFAAPKAYRPERDVFMQIGQLMWSWLSGVVGGYVTRFLYARARQSSAHNRRNATELSDAVSD